MRIISFSYLQFFTFLNMILVGGIIGLIFDFYRVLKRKMIFSVYLSNLFDFLIFLIFTFIVFVRLIQLNGGQVRWYIFLGVIVGNIIYYFSISKIAVKNIMIMTDSSLKVYYKIKKIFLKILGYVKLIITKLK
ncbi:spore cortex biosynthesis protein YabQ [Halanaerobacter jeridensis]|uniref:Spore cortex biosynthesis protein YabQ n=1 Tax=Halanaerobacter jeridensis TaxID=706427 RepID=A0A939BMR1_9FIRM|nr:spore cortex biosynthesis protein YabQ [Halanaerobacter jeridensis]